GEPVGVGKLRVEQHQLGPQPLGLAERGGSVHGFADDVEALRLEHRPRQSPEGGMVVDDQYRERHARIVPYGENAGNTASRTPSYPEEIPPAQRETTDSTAPRRTPGAASAPARAACGSPCRGSARGRDRP